MLQGGRSTRGALDHGTIPSDTTDPQVRPEALGPSSRFGAIATGVAVMLSAILDRAQLGSLAVTAAIRSCLAKDGGSAGGCPPRCTDDPRSSRAGCRSRRPCGAMIRGARGSERLSAIRCLVQVHRARGSAPSAVPFLTRRRAGGKPGIGSAGWRTRRPAAPARRRRGRGHCPAATVPGPGPPPR